MEKKLISALSKIVLSFALMFNSEAKLVKLATKQSMENLRFLSQDGEITYFQNQNGDLLLSKMYKNFKVMEGGPQAHYNLVTTEARKKILVEYFPYFFSTHSIQKPKSIFVLDWGEDKVKKLGLGTDPTLHLYDTWVSIFNARTKTITFTSMVKDESFKVVLKNPRNAFFIPKVVMINEGNIFYTDVNKEGLQAILHLNRRSRKTRVFWKSPHLAFKGEICKLNKSLIFGIFPLVEKQMGSKIYSIAARDLLLWENNDLIKKNLVYQSDLNDLGNISCFEKNDLVYFIKNVTKKKSPVKNETEICEIDMKTKKVSVQSSLKNLAHIINMDGRLLVPHLGNYYVLQEKEKSVPQDDFLKSTEQSIFGF